MTYTWIKGKHHYVIKNFSWRVKSSIKPKTISDIKKIQNFVKTSNANGNLEE
jgi:hypothetical protein